MACAMRRSRQSLLGGLNGRNDDSALRDGSDLSSNPYRVAAGHKVLSHVNKTEDSHVRMLSPPRKYMLFIDFLVFIRGILRLSRCSLKDQVLNSVVFHKGEIGVCGGKNISKGPLCWAHRA